MSARNPYEEASRIRKAIGLIAAMDAALGSDACSNVVELLLDDDTWWEGLAVIGRVKSPSRETRLLVLQLLRDRETKADIKATNDDPFRGLPGV